MSTTAGTRAVPQPPGGQAQPADLPDDTAAKAPATAGPAADGLDGPAPTATGEPPAQPDQTQAAH